MFDAGGHFIIRSQKNEGTTAELWLPTAVADIADGEETGGEEPDHKAVHWGEKVSGMGEAGEVGKK